MNSLWLSGRALKYRIWRPEVWFLMGTQNFFKLVTGQKISFFIKLLKWYQNEHSFKKSTWSHCSNLLNFKKFYPKRLLREYTFFLLWHRLLFLAVSYRLKLHKRLLLPENRPLMRPSNRYKFENERQQGLWVFSHY